MASVLQERGIGARMVQTARRVSEDEMLLCFLRAEMDSPTEATGLVATLERCGLDPEILTEPDLHDSAERRARRDLFNEYRGRQPVFAGLPWHQLTWYEATLTETDLRGRTFSCRSHFESTYATRRIDEIAADWDRQKPPTPNGIAARIQRGELLEPPILSAEPGLGKLVVLEGHNRLISYLRRTSTVAFPLPGLVGISAHASQWSSGREPAKWDAADTVQGGDLYRSPGLP